MYSFSKSIKSTIKKASFGMMMCVSLTVHSQVSTCDALTLFGNAMSERLCNSLSSGAQNHWVCSFTYGTPDIHATFNATTDLHITVRGTECQGHSYLDSSWPAPGLTLGAAQPVSVCHVNVDNYVSRLNAVNRMPAQKGQTLCTTPFIYMIGTMRMSPAAAQTYIDNCNNNQCP